MLRMNILNTRVCQILTVVSLELKAVRSVKIGISIAVGFSQ